MEGNQSVKGLSVEIPNKAISLKLRNMRWKALPASIVGLVFLLFVVACANQDPPPRSATKTINNPEGGTIVYGQVDGQTTEAGAMRAVLQSLQNQYGDRPEVGRVFRVRDTNSFAVFFTLKRNQGNVKVAGMLIVSRFSPTRIEAALVSDDAARFGSTVNPMLSKLFSVWHPGGEASPSDSAGGTSPASYSSSGEGSSPASAAALRPFTLPDRSASVSLPDGWRVNPERSGGGTLEISGPNGERAGLALARSAVDPTNQKRRQLHRGGIRDNTSGKIVYPYNVNLVKAFPEIFQQFRRVNGLGPAQLQIARAEQLPTARGERCVHVTGNMNPDGKGMQEMNTVLCTTAPSQFGDYSVLLYHTLLPKAVADKERATMGAVLASYRINQAVVNRQASAIAAPGIAAIKAVGDAARKRATETSALHDQQNRAWERGQDSKAKRSKAFSNYQLDQTVIRDNVQNTHGTGWNKTADSLVRSNPQRYEYVNTSDFRKGIDY
jgi:hypothetical protein